MSVQASPDTYSRICRQVEKTKFKYGCLGLAFSLVCLAAMLLYYTMVQISYLWIVGVVALCTLFLIVYVQSTKLISLPRFFCEGCRRWSELSPNWTCGICHQEHRSSSLRSIVGRFTGDVKFVTDPCFCKKVSHSYRCPHCQEVTIFDPARYEPRREAWTDPIPQPGQERHKPRPKTMGDYMEDDYLKDDLR
jgi:hypothetical protein